MARPPLPEATRKGRLIGVRFTSGEVERLDALSSDRSAAVRELLDEALDVRRKLCRFRRTHLDRAGRCPYCGTVQDGTP